jgi:hypothetical protein
VYTKSAPAAIAPIESARPSGCNINLHITRQRIGGQTMCRLKTEAFVREAVGIIAYLFFL